MSTEQLRDALREIPPPYPTGTRFPLLLDPKYPIHRRANEVEPFLRLIVDRFHPKKIIIFGSQACGNPAWDSDVDLLVVRDDIASENDGSKEILRALWDVPGKRPSFTILVKSSARIADRLATRSPFYVDILQLGVVVYAA